MARGGKREGSGRRSTWKHSKTRLIRVPEEFVDQVLDFARKLDNGEGISIARVIAPAKTSILPNQLSLLDDQSPWLCPKCGSSSLWKNGSLKDGRQKYKCQTCEHKFTPK